MELRRRKQNRLEGYDYGRTGCYFVTVCTKERAELFWDFSAMRSVGADIIRPRSPILSPYGLFAEEAIQQIPQCYPGVSVEKYVVMPNHIHMILFLTQTQMQNRGRMISAPTKALPIVVGQMKRAVS